MNSKKQQHPFQPFEVALVRKLEAKTSSVRDAFLLLDIDGDGRISPSDVRTVLHNELGLDMTKDQEDILLTRIPNNEMNATTTTTVGLSYSEFAKYYQAVSASPLPASQSGLAAAVGFQSNSTTNTHEMSIHLQPNQIIHNNRHKLRQLLSSHSSRPGEHGSGSGMKETSLFLAIDVHRSGKVSMLELLDWINTTGMFNWGMDDLQEVVFWRQLDKKLLKKRWFGSFDAEVAGKNEEGMTEHEFAEFVESLDSE